ncbi:site-specific integrase, partial [Roseiarcaceae bacterium H3SJ34-1]|uniref:site-specific integrase n=1 Tax=Terripilifer ovatus TaxID=3032367 RepID=UPI003AB96F59|nr:site-specific integrase [Roseiarcaceae bacterium H3SJ34-1]
MDDITSRSVVSDPASRRALQLDALAAILPIEGRDRLSEILTDQDVATLTHLAREGIGPNTLRALASDLAYLEIWALAATGSALPWPAPEALLLKFVAHHLWDPVQREADPAHGMPAEVILALRARGFLLKEGPPAVATVQRRLANWATLHRWRGLESPFGTPALKTALRLSVRANQQPRGRKSQRAVTLEVLETLLATCAGTRLVDIRDRAILLLAFASGGRRRSEVASLRVAQLSDGGEVPVDPANPKAGLLPSLIIKLGRTKTSQTTEDQTVVLVGRPVIALQDWLRVGRIGKGAVFRAIDRWQRVGAVALTPQSINQVLKTRCRLAGLDPIEFSAHGLRSGYLTAAARQGVSLVEAMQQSQHRSVQQAARYFNDAERVMGKAA